MLLILIAIIYISLIVFIVRDAGGVDSEGNSISKETKEIWDRHTRLYH